MFRIRIALALRLAVAVLLLLTSVTAHGYDATGRIQQTLRQLFAGQAANSERFQYDPAGNILDNAAQDALQSRTRHLQEGYVKNNLVRVFEDKRYFYDGHGRLIKKLAGKHTEQRFKWDEENRLIEVTTIRRPETEHQSTQTTKFDYDALGRNQKEKVVNFAEDHHERTSMGWHAD